MLVKRMVSVVVAFLAMGQMVRSDDLLKVLIVDGQNNHNWQATTPLLERILEDSGHFEADIATSPPKGQDLSSFRPKFSAYDAVLSNYNGALWSKESQDDLVDYVKGGGGLVVVHAANNSFREWPEYNEMIGLGWRGSDFGDRLTYSEDNKLVRTPKGEGPGAGHGPQHAFAVIMRDHEHPISRDLPHGWMHAKDELYHGQRGPAANMRILATAYSPQKGVQAHEPMMWVIPYGEGRVFTSVMGHADYSMKCVGFITTLLRGTEWAATGKVTVKIPDDFPTESETRTRY